MAIFDSIGKAAKDFFIEPDDENSPDKPKATQPGAPVATGAVPFPAAAAPAPVVVQAEQRHLDHMAQLLAGDGKDFASYLKMVKSMAAAGMSGPLLYQTAYNAFSAVSGSDVPGLLMSADRYEQLLQDDRAKVLQRHREKMGETSANGANAGPIPQLVAQEKKLAADIAELGRQLQLKQQELTQTQQQLAAERQKTQGALASYELAFNAALAELQAHHKAAQSFLMSK